MLVAGFDEVGRGAWAGPLLVAGVVMRAGTLTGLKDSKQYSPQKRAQLTLELLTQIIDIKLVWVQPDQIDRHGLGSALAYSFSEAANHLKAEKYFIDGSVDYINSSNSITIIKGDEKESSIAAASIIAKHYRDTYMKLLDRNMSGYGFSRNVGYGTADHIQALKMHGITDFHRKSYRPVARYE